ncbi:MAG TPA: CBS domain-containing protein [Methanocorpusculum sp.]|nr:CBS domain-containing protein [Methanocorpusculum sp.]
MSSSLITTPVNTPVSRVVNLMLAKNISIIPIEDGERIIGLATRKSLIDAL